MHRPNIVLILTDQQALHAVSCYGAPICRTPHIDRLAADGVRFTRAYTPCALCTPARAGLLTGLYPHNHGAMYNSGTHLPFTEAQIGRRLESYPQQLKSQGYRLGYVGKRHAGIADTCQKLGFEGYGPRGYGDVWNADPYWSYLEKRGLQRPERVFEFYAEGQPRYALGDGGGYAEGPAEAMPSAFVARTALELIEGFAAGDRPFLLACNFWGPHAPYLPCDDYRDLYDPGDIPPWPSFEDDLRGRPHIHRVYRDSVFPRAGHADWPTWARMVARYYGQASMIDAQIGRLLDGLEDMDLYDDTLILFASDHGDTVGIHGGAFDKGAMAYEEIYHVPLIVKLPGGDQAGTTREQWVSLLDLTPTLCEAAGTEMARADGQSLWPLLADADAPGREQLMAQFHGHRFPVAQRILWWDRYKYVLNFGDTDELYDLADDAGEMHNRIADSELLVVRAELRERLLDEMWRVGDTLGPQARYILERPVQL